ncbi:unnamed protein product [Orchesella dallaii]|uniref:Uncharacterized protein n=1 Tax=Orchesella dallaii TaxID=48710 RepID=A0ABP1RT00_9HEXA
MSNQKLNQCIFQSMSRSKICAMLTWALPIILLICAINAEARYNNTVCARRITSYDDRNCTGKSSHSTLSPLFIISISIKDCTVHFIVVQTIGAAIDVLPYHVDNNYLCYDLPSNWHDRASSMDTHNNCVMVWNRAGCTGKWQRITSSPRYVNNLVDLYDFDKEIRSVRQCS